MKIYFIYDNREGKYIERPYTSVGAAKAYVAHLRAYKKDILSPDRYYNDFKQDELTAEFLENADEYDHVRYNDQTRFQVRMFDLEQLDYEVI